MPNLEPSEREVIFRIANDQDHWDIYITEGATGSNKILRQMKITRQDENGTHGTLPRKAVSIRTVGEDGATKRKREYTDEQRAAISERFKRYHANKKVTDNEDGNNDD